MTVGWSETSLTYHYIFLAPTITQNDAENGCARSVSLDFIVWPAGDFSMAQIFKDLSKLTSTILLALSIASCAGPGAAPVEKSESSSPPGYTRTRGGDAHDFDYFAGGWTTRQRRLKTRGVGGAEWEEFPATLCMSPYLGGMTTVDELYFPTKGWAGLTLRTFDLEKRQWSIYWVSSASGRLE